MPADTTEPIELQFARFAGEAAESFNFNRSLGQIYGLLYVSADRLSLGDICQQLSMSKGNASINLRLLESWGAVRPVSVVGSRRDHYEANRDIKEVALRRLREGLTKRLDRAEDRFLTIVSQGNGSRASADTLKRILELQSLLTKGRRALKFASQWFS